MTNQLSNQWDSLRTDSESRLLNRATQGVYPPGSTFKIITLLEFMREYPEEYRNFHYDCNGVMEQGDYTIQCYHKTAHGSQNLEEAFANSCNGAFAAIGMMLDQKSCLEQPRNCYMTRTFRFRYPTVKVYLQKQHRMIPGRFF